MKFRNGDKQIKLNSNEQHNVIYFSENVSRALGSNFSVSLTSRCKSSKRYDCETGYTILSKNAGDKRSSTNKIITVKKEMNMTKIKQKPSTDVNIYYEYMKINTERVIFNLTLVSSGHPATVVLKTRYHAEDCSGLTEFGSVSFKGTDFIVFADTVFRSLAFFPYITNGLPYL